MGCPQFPAAYCGGGGSKLRSTNVCNQPQPDRAGLIQILPVAACLSGTALAVAVAITYVFAAALAASAVDVAGDAVSAGC